MLNGKNQNIKPRGRGKVPPINTPLVLSRCVERAFTRARVIRVPMLSEIPMICTIIIIISTFMVSMKTINMQAAFWAGPR